MAAACEKNTPTSKKMDQTRFLGARRHRMSNKMGTATARAMHRARNRKEVSGSKAGPFGTHVQRRRAKTVPALGVDTGLDVAAAVDPTVCVRHLMRPPPAAARRNEAIR
jgi:hypothetical protein